MHQMYSHTVIHWHTPIVNVYAPKTAKDKLLTDKVIMYNNNSTRGMSINYIHTQDSYVQNVHIYIPLTMYLTFLYVRIKIYKQITKNSGITLPGICPYYSFFKVIYCKAIRPGSSIHIFIYDLSFCSTHRSRFNARKICIPVCPKQNSGETQGKQIYEYLWSMWKNLNGLMKN